MRNQPEFHFFKNTLYAIDGFIDVYKTETAFRIELVLFVLFEVGNIFLPIELFYKFIIGMVLFIPIMAEMTNSAIERIVDLVSPDYHILAKQAKDAGAAIVFTSLAFTGLSIIFTLMFAFGIF